jgi:hypothetical protein
MAALTVGQHVRVVGQLLLRDIAPLVNTTLVIQVDSAAVIPARHPLLRIFSTAWRRLVGNGRPATHFGETP